MQKKEKVKFISSKANNTLGYGIILNYVKSSRYLIKKKKYIIQPSLITPSITLSKSISLFEIRFIFLNK